MWIFVFVLFVKYPSAMQATCSRSSSLVKAIPGLPITEKVVANLRGCLLRLAFDIEVCQLKNSLAEHTP